MTAQHAEPPAPARNRPAKTLDDVVRVMTGDVDADFKQQFQDALKRAWAKARAECSLEPLTNLVENWHPYACQWINPAEARAYYARIDRYMREGIPQEERISSEQVLQALEAKWGKGTMGPTWDKLAGRA